MIGRLYGTAPSPSWLRSHGPSDAMTILCGSGPLGTAAGQVVSGGLTETYGVEVALFVALVVGAGASTLALT